MNTALFSDINWLAVLVATVAYYILGAIWYSALFSKPWIRYQGIDMNAADAKKGTGAIMGIAFVLFFIITIGLAILVERLNLINGAMSGIKLGLVTGICFSAMVLSITYLYTKKPWGLHGIDGAFHVVGQVIAAIILCVWR